MFCPTCGVENQDQVKFCRRCGANLSAVLKALDRGATKAPEPQGASDLRELTVQTLVRKIEETKAADHNIWEGSPLPRMLAQLERLTMTPEERRRASIRRGLLTTGIGLGVSLFLYLFLGALASTEFIPDEVAPILRMIWSVGLIPVSIGLMIMLNGLLVGRGAQRLDRKPAGVESGPGATSDRSFSPERTTIGSVTEQTTTRLEPPEDISSKRSIGRRTAADG